LDGSALEVLFFSGGASCSGAKLVLIFLSLLAIIFPDADLFKTELSLIIVGHIFPQLCA
jgi:hypothetical protein